MIAKKKNNPLKFLIFLIALSILIVSATTTFAIQFLNTSANNLGAEEEAKMENKALAMLGIGIAFAAAAIGAGIGIYGAGSAVLSAAAERPELSTLAIIITALAEAIAIYGLVVVILMLAKV